MENLPTKHKNPYNGQNYFLMHPLLNYKPLGYVEPKQNALKKVRIYFDGFKLNPSLKNRFSEYFVGMKLKSFNKFYIMYTSHVTRYCICTTCHSLIVVTYITCTKFASNTENA